MSRPKRYIKKTFRRISDYRQGYASTQELLQAARVNELFHFVLKHLYPHFEELCPDPENPKAWLCKLPLCISSRHVGMWLKGLASCTLRVSISPEVVSGVSTLPGTLVFSLVAERDDIREASFKINQEEEKAQQRRDATAQRQHREKQAELAKALNQPRRIRLPQRACERRSNFRRNLAAHQPNLAGEQPQRTGYHRGAMYEPEEGTVDPFRYGHLKVIK